MQRKKRPSGVALFMSGVLVVVLFLGIWLAAFAPTQPKIVITFAFLPPGQAIPLVLFGSAYAHLLSETGSSVMYSGGGVICYVPEVTQETVSGYPRNFIAPGGTRQATLRCIAKPTFTSDLGFNEETQTWEGEPTVTVNWQYSTPGSLASTSPQSGTVQVQAGSFTDVPITITNKASSGTAYFSAIKYQASSDTNLGAAYTTEPYATEVVGYVLQNLCSAASPEGAAPDVACAGAFYAPAGYGYDSLSGTWINTSPTSSAQDIISSSTTTRTVTTVVSGTTTTSTTTEIIQGNQLVHDPYAFAEQVTLPTYGIVISALAIIGLALVNRKQLAGLM